MEYSRAALGEVIRDLRESRHPKLSQEELGRQAGYRSGAGVSMSRIENGITRPGPRRLEGIATALGITVHDIEVRSAQRTRRPNGAGQPDGAPQPDGSGQPDRSDRPSDPKPERESTRDRMRRIQREFDHRQSQAVSRGQAFNVAHDRARDDFFLELARSTRGVSGLPTTADASAADLRDASSAVADALLRQRVAVDGLTTALASCAAARAVDHETDQEAAYTAVIAAAMLAPAPADRVETGPPPGATARATRALLGGGTAATVALVTGFVATAASPLIAAGALAWLVRRSRRQNDQLRIELDQAESNLVTTQRGFEAGMGLLAEATDILGYIAVHASHALRRWRATLPTAPAEWSDLGTDQQHAYTTFVEIAAHQVCVDSIDVTGLLAAPAQRQTALIEAAEAILAHARHKVELLV